MQIETTHRSGRFVRSLAVVPLLLALLLAACGDTDEPTDPGTDTTPAQGANSAPDDESDSDEDVSSEGDTDATAGGDLEGGDDPADASAEHSDQEDQVANKGDNVSVHYEGKLDNGEVFDSSREREPLEFEVGSGTVIPGFESAVEGMSVGESKTVSLEPEDAYGERRDDLVLNVPKDQAPEGLNEGDMVQLSNGAPATVVGVDDAAVTIDANHQLAGQRLTFEIELVDVK